MNEWVGACASVRACLRAATLTSALTCARTLVRNCVGTRGVGFKHACVRAQVGELRSEAQRSALAGAQGPLQESIAGVTSQECKACLVSFGACVLQRFSRGHNTFSGVHGRDIGNARCVWCRLVFACPSPRHPKFNVPGPSQCRRTNLAFANVELVGAGVGW